MKWTRSIFFITKSITSVLMIYLLLTTFNDRGYVDITQLITYQFLYPFPVLPNETVNFLRIIMALGISFICFSATFLLMSNFADGGRELVRFHAKNESDYYYKISKTISSHYLLEFCFQMAVVLCLTIVIPHLKMKIGSIFYLFATWFIIDSLCFLLIQIYSLSSVMVIIALIIENLVRYLLMKHILGFLVILAILFLFNYYRKEKYHAEN